MFVSVPPEKPVIYDAKSRDRTKLIEAYNEGSDVSLVCEVTGGKFSMETMEKLQMTDFLRVPTAKAFLFHLWFTLSAYLVSERFLGTSNIFPVKYFLYNYAGWPRPVTFAPSTRNLLDSTTRSIILFLTGRGLSVATWRFKVSTGVITRGNNSAPIPIFTPVNDPIFPKNS